jgi:hypothetical protein
MFCIAGISLIAGGSIGGHAGTLAHRWILGTVLSGRGPVAAAREIRSQRADLKQDLRRGRCSAASVILAPPKCAEGARLREILLAVPGIGPLKCERLIRGVEVTRDARIRDLSEPSRNALASAVARLQQRTDSIE